MTRIVMDVSSSFAFAGKPPVGIIRAEREFARFLLSQSSQAVAFCRLARDQGRYLAVSTAEIRDVLDGTVVAIAPAAPVSATAPLPLKAQLKAWAKRLPERAPISVREELHAWLAAAWQVAKAGKAFLKSWRRPADPTGAPRHTAGDVAAMPVEPPPPAGTFVFDRNDVYVAMGLDWQHNDWTLLWREKRKHGFKTVLHCYDTIPVKLPHLMGVDMRDHFERYFTDLAHTADHVSAISACSRHDLLTLLQSLGAPQPQVSVLHLGSDLSAEARGDDPHLHSLANKPFVLYVSTIEPRKNHRLLMHVWEELAKRHAGSAPTLVLVGSKGWGVTQLMRELELNPLLADHVLLLHGLTDQALAWLYERALFCVFPSWYEGWGLPVTEALAHGRVCVCANTASLPEAAQDLLPLLDPLDTAAWIAEVEHLWQDDAYRAVIEQRIRAEYRPRSWQHHGDDLLSLAAHVSTSPASA